MELGGGDKYVANHPAHCSLLVWFLCLVRYLMSSPIKLDTNTSLSASVWAVEINIGSFIGALLSAGVMFLGFTSLAAAFVPGCPFRSAFSDVIRFIFEILRRLTRWIPCERLRWLRWLRNAILAILWLASEAAVAYATLEASSWFSLFFISATIPIAYSTQREAVHKPQKYKISCLAVWAFLFVATFMLFAVWFKSYAIFSSLYSAGVLVLAFACWMVSKMSKSMADTGEIDAIVWILTTTHPQKPAAFFKKAGQMTGDNSIGRHYRPRLLESLMPLLTPLITSHHTTEPHSFDTHPPQSANVFYGRPLTGLTLVNDYMVPIDEDQHLQNLEIYLACLARLSEFTDRKGTFWRMKEDAMRHPKLEQRLIDKLLELANAQHVFQVGLKNAATKVLSNYKLNKEGIPLKSPATVLEIVATDPREEATWMLNDDGLNNQEQGQSEMYRLEDRAPRVEPDSAATSTFNDTDLKSQEQGQSEVYRLEDRAPRVEPDSAATSTFNDSDLNSQEQGHSELHRLLMDRATCDDLVTQVGPARQ